MDLTALEEGLVHLRVSRDCRLARLKAYKSNAQGHPFALLAERYLDVNDLAKLAERLTQLVLRHLVAEVHKVESFIVDELLTLLLWRGFGVLLRLCLFSRGFFRLRLLLHERLEVVIPGLGFLLALAHDFEEFSESLFFAFDLRRRGLFFRLKVFGFLLALSFLQPLEP